MLGQAEDNPCFPIGIYFYALIDQEFFMASSEPSVETTPSEPRPTGLSFGDGFQFGCGLFSAGLLAGVIVLLALLLIGLLLSLTGVNLLSSLLGQAPLP